LPTDCSRRYANALDFQGVGAYLGMSLPVNPLESLWFHWHEGAIERIIDP
jgi:hypothetical protein